MVETPTQLTAITREEILRRAKSCIGRGEYKLGRGGFDPNAATPWPTGPKEFCDCSGFVAFCIAEDRENHGIGGGWIETTMILADARGAQQMFEVVVGAAIPGDLIVYGDHVQRIGDHQSFKHDGHVGVISQVDAAGRAYRVIHCSRGNFKSRDFAIDETDPDAFVRRGGVVVRPKKIVEGV